MTPAMARFRATHAQLREATGKPPALSQVAEALGIADSSAERTRDKLRLAGVELPFTKLKGHTWSKVTKDAIVEAVRLVEADAGRAEWEAWRERAVLALSSRKDRRKREQARRAATGGGA